MKKKKQDIILPEQMVRKVTMQYPNAWRQYDMFREAKAKGEMSWHDWCYAPMAAAYSIVSGGGDNRLRKGDTLNLNILHFAAAWRVSKGVYRFDADVYDELIHQKFDSKLPIEIFFRLPEYCVYLETPGLSYDAAWVTLEDDQNSGNAELRILLVKDGGTPRPIPLILKPDCTIEDAFDAVCDSAITNITELNLLDEGALTLMNNQNVRHEAALSIKKIIEPLINLIIYLCSDEPDINDVIQHPSSMQGRKGNIYAADKPRRWDVGFRIGSSIRKYRNSDKRYEGTNHMVHNSPRPHIRRAHYHSFWTGPKDSTDRNLILKWLPPIPVNIDENAELPVVLHPVA